MKKIPIIIDTDPGIDDAVAISIALNHPNIDVKLISAVFGNAGIDNTTKNALKLVTFFNKDVPVARGFERPLIREIQLASNVHGITGMDGYDFKDINYNLLSKNHAVDEIANVLKNSDEKITIVPIGSLTNIAILLRMHPELKEKIAQIVLMGGAIGRGNVSPYREANIKKDPEAAKIVFESGIKIVVAPLEAADKALISQKTIETLKNLNETGLMFASIFDIRVKVYAERGVEGGEIPLYDPCTIAYLTRPEMFKTVETYIEIDTQNDISAGQTYVDLDKKMNKENNATIIVDTDTEKFNEWIIEMTGLCHA